MASAFTSTTSALIVDTTNSGNTVTFQNVGSGILDLVYAENPSETPTASASNMTVTIAPGAYWETPPGTVGRIFGAFRTAGTAYWSQISRR